MASLTQWAWVWVNSGSWWWTGRPGLLQSMGSQRVRHDWATELNWTALMKVKEESEKSGLKLNIQKTKIMALGPITSRQINGETMETVTDFISLVSKITSDGDCSHEIKTLAPWKKSYGQPRQHIEKQRHYFANKGLSSQSYGFSSSCTDVRIGPQRKISTEELMLLNCGVGEDSWEFLGLQDHQTRRNQPWIFIGRTDAEAEVPILWPPAVMSRLIGKDPDVGKYWRQEEKGTTEDETVGCHHRLNGQEFAQVPGYGEGQGSLACCSPWGRKESDTTEWLNNKWVLEWLLTFLFF